MVLKMFLLCFLVAVASAVPAAQPAPGGWGPGANPWFAWKVGAGAGGNPFIPPWLSTNPWIPSWASGAGAGATNPWIPAWGSSGSNAGGSVSPWASSGPSAGGAANPWAYSGPSGISAVNPWYPQWTPCSTIGSDCLDCNTRVVCTKVGGIQRSCSGTLPHCNLGQCSATPSAQCSPNFGMSSADAEDEVV